MKAILEIEAIGENLDSYLRIASAKADSIIVGLGDAVFYVPQRFGVYEITRRGPRKLFGKTDYSRSNSRGSRGVYKYYELESGHYYFVRSPMSWSRTDEYFCAVNNDGDIKRIAVKEVSEWLKNVLE